MKIILAFDKFKGCLTASEVCSTVAEAIHRLSDGQMNVISMPMSDGGDGMQEILDAIEPSGATTFIETARWCGLSQLPPDKRNPAKTSTYPLGQAIASAVASGSRHIVVGLGGSSTNDAGAGMLQALGCKFLDRSGRLITEHICGELLPEVAAVDFSAPLPGLAQTKFTAICDVDSPLFGPTGAAYVFAPQKGASPDMVKMLDSGLRHFAEVAGDALADHPGDGAAGGLGYAFRLFLKAELIPGIDYIMRAYRFDDALAGADLVITGEGRSDAQTLMGKVPMGVLRHAQAHGVPTCLMSGSISNPDAFLRAGFSHAVAVTPPDMPLSEALNPDVARRNLRAAVMRMATS